jgi:hypothetical protein
MALYNNTHEQPHKKLIIANHNKASPDQDNNQHNRTTNNENILNLSDYVLTQTDKDTLNLGLSFVPSTNKAPAHDIQTALDRLTRRLKLIDFFDDGDNETWDGPTADKLFTKPSTWTPRNRDISDETRKLIKRLKETTEKTLRGYKIDDKNNYHFHEPHHNLTNEQRNAIQTLKNNDDIIIKPADKGGLVCVLNKTSYMTEAYRQLNNAKYYRRIDTPRRTETIPQINKILHRLHHNNFITNKQLQYLSANDKKDKERNFYLLPKVHKPRDKWPQQDMPEGRPIVADCNTESRRVSDYIDHFLKPLANRHASYIKDTYQFIDKIRGQTIDKNCLLVTGDITALYTNMDIDRTLTVTKQTLAANPNPNRPDNELMELLELTMKNNDFRFNNDIFLQIFGTAMGKPYAPSLANIYLIDFDDKAMNTFRIKPKLYYRFLDDIFFVWTGTRTELTEYENYLNTLIPDIKITLTADDTEANFLDTTIFKHTAHDVCTLQTRTFFKATTTHQLLHTTSFHPPHTTRGVLKSQVLRFKRLSSFKSDFDNACHTLFEALRRRGYNKRLLRKTKRDIWYYHNAESGPTQVKTLLPVVIPFSPIGTQLIREWRRRITDHDTFSNFHIIAAYKKHRNLTQLLTHKDTHTHTAPQNKHSAGAYKCNSPRCHTCDHLTPTNQFSSTYTRRNYRITDRLNCKSQNIIYLITCTQCRLQYVGETARPLADRLANHKSTIRHFKDTPIATHFNQHDHAIRDLKITPIEQIKHTDSRGPRLERERYWMEELMSYSPFGINRIQQPSSNKQPPTASGTGTSLD